MRSKADSTLSSGVHWQKLALERERERVLSSLSTRGELRRAIKKKVVDALFFIPTKKGAPSTSTRPSCDTYSSRTIDDRCDAPFKGTE
jgi:hypothetical protein